MNKRWRIAGTFTTAAPLHVGSGEITGHKALVDQHGEPCDVAAVVKDYKGTPCIPGTAIKGVLRAWAERFYTSEATKLDGIFGHRIDGDAGWAEFCTAFAVVPVGKPFADHVPYWYENPVVDCTRAKFTGVASNVCIDRHTGAAAKNKLFYQEFVPEGVAFAVEIDATRLNPDDIALLLAILERGSGHATHRYQFGANGADGWGRVTWQLRSVTTGTAAKLPASAVGFACCTTPAGTLPIAPEPAAPPAHVALELTLAFQGPFLVNDQSRAKVPGIDDGRTDFAPLKRSDGTVWLPASSFRGVLRSRAEFLANSSVGGMNPSVERLFGQTSQAARLSLTEFVEVGKCDTTRRQDFVAIDRFTGGAAEGAKFDATYADRPTLTTRLTLALDKLDLQDQALLAAALRDLCRGRATFGFGGSKGYGQAEGTWCAAGEAWMRSLPPLVVVVPSQAVTAPRPDSPRSSPAPALLKVGALIWEGVGTKRRRSIAVASQKLPQQVRADQLAADLSQAKDETLPVEFELDKGQPVRVRRAGSAWATSGPGTAGRFANPYYFLRLAERTKFAGDLGDAAPVGHGRYVPGQLSGTVRVKLTTKTPLLICDDGVETDVAGHRSYGVRLDADGKPLLASSSVRGMVRAAYEAVTNSRLGVFPFKPDEDDLLRRGNSRRYGYRMNAGEGLSVVPARIEGGAARLMMGTNLEFPYFDDYLKRWLVPGGLLHAAWVHRYLADSKTASPDAVKLGGQPPNHGDEGWCWLEKIQHFRWNNGQKQWVADFAFWAVREAKPTEAQLSLSPPQPRPGSDKYRTTGETRRGHGYFLVSNQNIKNKHDERFFFTTPEAAPSLLPIAESVASRYCDLVRDYQAVHHAELETRRSNGKRPDEYLGGEPGKTAWSLHVYDQGATRLEDGTLCYAAVTDGVVEALYPVTISRKLYERSPLDLLPDSLRPATAMTKLSPADRVFGWVSQDKATVAAGEPAYRSQVRVGPVACVSDGAVEEFDPPEVLAILGQPKPAQGRFYLGKKAAGGKAQDNGISKEAAGYHDGNRVRGPKVYPHHAQGLVEAAWRSQEPDPKKRRGSQNRSVTGWVKAGVTFAFDLHVTNLSRVELGGLLWLLSLPDDHFLRLGLGKPLGFGSVRAEVVPEGTCLADGADWTNALGTWDATPATHDRQPLRDEFEAEMMAANPDLIPAFRKSAQGFGDLPIHYPPQVTAAGGHFEWFRDNERPGTNNQTAGLKLALPDLTALTGPSLPNNPVGPS